MNLKLHRLNRIAAVSLAMLMGINGVFAGNIAGAASQETDTFVQDDVQGAEKAYQVSFRKVDSWEGHINGEITIKNTGDAVIKDWQLGMDFDGKIENIWNASVVSEDGRVIITNAGWNKDVAVGDMVSFGFIAATDNEDVKVEGFCLLGIDDFDSEDYVMDRDEIVAWEANLAAEPEKILGNMLMAQNFAVAKGNEYSYGVPLDISDFGFSIAGKKAIFHLDVAFNWNGKYVYATDDHFMIVFQEKGLKITDIKTEITRSANKSKVCAKYIKKITLKNVAKNRTRTVVIGYQCTPKGVMKRVNKLI